MKPLAQSDFVADRGIAGRVAARLVPAVRATRGFFARRRKLAMAIASILFVGGLAWAVDSAGIALARIEGQWLVAALALGFVGVILNGFELSRCAGALGKKVPAPEAINLSSVGILSNLLPIPASALVRGGALMATGATLAQSGRILLYVGLLRVSVAGAITGLALISGPFGWPVVAGSCLASAILFALIGLSLGVLIGSSKLAYDTASPLLVGISSIPKVAVVPILVLWFGAGTVPAILTAMIICIFPIVVNVSTGIATVEPELEDVMRSLKAKRWEMLWNVGLPRSMPYFFASLKVAITLSFVGSVIAETVASNKGVGNMMLIASSSFNVPLVFSGLMILAIMGITLYAIFSAVERRMVGWALRKQ